MREPPRASRSTREALGAVEVPGSRGPGQLFLNVTDRGRDRFHRRRSRLFGLGCGSSSARQIKDHQSVPNRDDVPFTAAELCDLAGLRGSDGYGRLVGHDFDHFLVFGDLVAHSNEPTDNFAFGYAFADVRQLELKF